MKKFVDLLTFDVLMPELPDVLITFSDFKRNYVLKQPLETVDFYQLLCFLMQIPPEDHDGEWSKIEPMMTISAATTSFNALSSVIMLTIASLLVLCYPC